MKVKIITYYHKLYVLINNNYIYKTKEIDKGHLISQLCKALMSRYYQMDSYKCSYIQSLAL